MIYSADDGAQSSQLRTLRGTQPGLLDPSQPSRLLRFPDSKLSFASFDPKTALAEDPSVQKSNTSGDLLPPKRIVIETTTKGASFWRFVPRARLEQGAQDEGVWPRVIDMCGEKIQCYQEQWEIYKLDPKYYCVVYPWPKCPSVTWMELSNQDLETAYSYSGKRSRWSSPETSEPIPQKKFRSHSADKSNGTSTFDSDSEESEDEDEVEEMVVDGNFSQKSRYNPRNAARRDRIVKERYGRWKRIRMVYEERVQDFSIPSEGSFSMRVDSDPIPPWPAEEKSKRKGDSFSESDNESDQMLSDRSPRRCKRTRTSSPQAQTSPLKPHRGANQNHAQRRLDRLRRHANVNRRKQEKKFSGFTFVPPEPVFEDGEDEVRTSSTEARSQMNNDDAGEAPREADSREAEIAESIRKLRELEKDRPLWEMQRKQREARERLEEQERLAKAERRRREEEQKQREQHVAAEREKRRAQQEAERLAREEELRQREIHQRRQRQRWESGPWTTHRALERYRMLSEEFDASKFTSGQVVGFHDIPWPVLHPPSRMTVEDVDWSAVEAFFATVKSHMRLQDYVEFVEKSHRRFHPDRWRARKIWAAVTDEVERGYLEVAANTVAQAITPIWKAIKER